MKMEVLVDQEGTNGDTQTELKREPAPLEGGIETYQIEKIENKMEENSQIVQESVSPSIEPLRADGEVSLPIQHLPEAMQPAELPVGEQSGAKTEGSQTQESNMIATAQASTTDAPSETPSPPPVPEVPLNSPIVSMACVVCGTTIEMPSYTALTRKCYMKCSSCNPDETHAKNWLDIILTALYNLEVLHKRKYFHCKNEICTFIDRHWNDICPERARTPTWGNTIMSQISTHPELFVSHQRGSGYWALKRKHFNKKKAEAEAKGEASGVVNQESVEGKKGEPEQMKQDGERRVHELKSSNSGIMGAMNRVDEHSKEFLVETIIGKRIMGGNVQYLLKWEGFGSTENTWEASSDLNCPELVQDFETRAQRPALWKSNPRRKRKSSELSDMPTDKEADKSNEPKSPNPLGLSAHANKRQRSRVRMIPVSQVCHQCKDKKPVIVCCDTCDKKYCEHCLEKSYDEDILEIQRNGKSGWVCPGCKGFCSCQECCSERGEEFVPRKKPRERVVSRIIARCRQEGSKEWEYLVHFKGCSSAKNTWIVSRSEISPDLLRKYKNSMKLRINKNKELPEQKNKKRPSGKGQRKSGQDSGKRNSSGNSSMSLRSPGLNKRGLRTSDFDITRVIFDDPNPKVIVPKKQEVLTPAWRVIDNAPPSNTPRKKNEPTPKPAGNSNPENQTPNPLSRSQSRSSTPIPPATPPIVTQTSSPALSQEAAVLADDAGSTSLTSLISELDTIPSSVPQVVPPQPPPEGPANIFRAQPIVPMGLPPYMGAATTTSSSSSPSSSVFSPTSLLTLHMDNPSPPPFKNYSWIDISEPSETGESKGASNELATETKPSQMEEDEELKYEDEEEEEVPFARLVDLRNVELDEGSSSEDTSDEAFATRHARYETKLPLLLEPPPKRPSTPKIPKKAGPIGRNKRRGLRDSGNNGTLSEGGNADPQSAPPAQGNRGKKRKHDRRERTSSKYRRKSEEGMAGDAQGREESKSTNSNSMVSSERRKAPKEGATPPPRLGSAFEAPQESRSTGTTASAANSESPTNAELLRQDLTNSTNILQQSQPSTTMNEQFETKQSQQPIGVPASVTSLLGSGAAISVPASYLSPMTSPSAPTTIFSPAPLPIPPPTLSIDPPVTLQTPPPSARGSSKSATQYSASSKRSPAARRIVAAPGVSPSPPTSASIPYAGSGLAYNTLSMTSKQHSSNGPTSTSAYMEDIPSANAFYAPPPSSSSSGGSLQSAVPLVYSPQGFGNSFAPVNGVMPPNSPSTPYVTLPSSTSPFNQFS